MLCGGYRIWVWLRKLYDKIDAMTYDETITYSSLEGTLWKAICFLLLRAVKLCVIVKNNLSIMYS